MKFGNEHGNSEEGGVAVEREYIKKAEQEVSDPNDRMPIDQAQVPEPKPEQFVVQTQFDLLVTPRPGESLADIVARALAVYKYESGIQVVGMTHKSYIPSENN